VATAVTAVADADALETEDSAGAALAVEVEGDIAGAAVTVGDVTATRLVSARSAPAPLPGEANGWSTRSSAAVAPARMADAITTVRRRDRCGAGGVSASFVTATGATLPGARESRIGAGLAASPDFDRARACSTQSTSVAE
jgi:hypothetical protein